MCEGVLFEESGVLIPFSRLERCEVEQLFNKQSIKKGRSICQQD